MAISLALTFLIQSILGLFTLVCLLRFYLQACRAPFQNSFALALMRLSDFAVLPLRRMIPPVWRWDSACLLLAIANEYCIQVLIRLANDFPLWVAGSQIWWVLLGFSLLAVLKLFIDIVLYAVIIQALLSWFNPPMAYHPVLHAMTQPLLSRLRKWIPQPPGIDLSPIAVVILAQLLKILLIGPLNGALVGAM